MKKPIVSILIVMLMGFFISSLSAKTQRFFTPFLVSDTAIKPVDQGFRLIPVTELAAKDTMLKKKAVAALFAFPFPFGFMGAHRVMLGTKPWVPFVYAVTFGGCFGLLPMIDFFVILFSKDIEQFENNPNIFMWIK